MFTTNRIDATLRVVRRRPILDQESGRAIGWARARRFRTAFSISDLDDEAVLLRVTHVRHGWTADALGHAITVVPAGNWGKRGLPVWGYPANPKPTWKGWVLDDCDSGDRFAYIREGMVVDANAETPVATLALQSTRWRNDYTCTWTLNITEEADLRFRVAALAWLGIAFNLQFGRAWLDD